MNFEHVLIVALGGIGTFALAWVKLIYARSSERELGIQKERDGWMAAISKNHSDCESRLSKLEAELKDLRSTYVQDLVNIVGKTTSSLDAATNAQQESNRGVQESTQVMSGLAKRFDTLLTLMDPLERLRRLQAGEKTPTVTSILKDAP